MKFVSFLFVVLLGSHNVRRILSGKPSHVIHLYRTDPRLSKAYGEETAKFSTDENRDTHITYAEVGYLARVNVTVQFSTRINSSIIFSDLYDRCAPQYNTVLRLHNRYKTNLSQINIDEGKYYDEDDGWYLGFFTSDMFSVKTPSLESVSQKLISLIKASPKYTQGKADSIISLRYDPENIAENFVTKLCGLYISKFSFFYPRRRIDQYPESSEGQLLMCGEDETIFHPGKIHWVRDMNPGHWQFHIQSILTSSNSQTTEIANKVVAEFDSATDRIGVPEKYIELLYNNINAKSIPNYPDKKQINCDTRNTNADLQMYIEGVLVVLHALDYTMWTKYPDGNIYCELLFKKVSGDVWILGDSFLRTTYTLFDITNKSIGFAKYRGG